MVPEGKVKIVINEEKSIEHERGCSLLQALSDEKVFVPSACGGGGTCGTCKGKVLEGGGELLPTEKAHITRKMAADNYRLFCQVKVRDDMKIEIPKEFFGIKKWTCTVLSNHNVATFIKELVLQLPDNETMQFKSGGYVQIDIPACSVLFVIGVWWIAGTLNQGLATPFETIERFIKLLENPIMGQSVGIHVWASMRRILAAFFLASVVGVSLGVAFGIVIQGIRLENWIR